MKNKASKPEKPEMEETKNKDFQSAEIETEFKETETGGTKTTVLQSEVIETEETKTTDFQPKETEETKEYRVSTPRNRNGRNNKCRYENRGFDRSKFCRNGRVGKHRIRIGRSRI